MPTPYAAYVAETISDLVNPQATGRNEVTVLGRNTKGDGGGGAFYWVTGSYSTDGGTVFPKSAVGSSPSGAWKRVIDSDFDVKWFGAYGDGIVDDTVSIQNAITASVLNDGATLRVSPGRYLLRNTVYSATGMALIGEPNKSTFIADSLFTGNGNMFEGIGHSNLRYENLIFTNNRSKFLNAFIQFKSSPNLCDNIKVINCKFNDGWVQAAIMMGQTAKTDPVHYNDNVLIEKCEFLNLYNPNHVQVTVDTDYFTSNWCAGILLEQTTLRSTIKTCRFYNTSGDGIHSYGAPDQFQNNNYYMNCTVEGCDFFNNYMAVELNGGHGGEGVLIQGNRLRYSSRIAGFLISLSCYRSRVENNYLLNAERGLIESASVDGVIVGNTGKIVCWTSSAQGVAPYAPLSASSNRIHFCELSGYNYLVADNNFQALKDAPTSNTPLEFNGISINGKNSEMDPNTQVHSYLNITDFSVFWDIKDNTFIGVTHRVLNTTVGKIRNVNFVGNTVVSTSLGDNALMIYGYGWSIKNNIFNMTSATPSAGQYLIKVFTDSQSDDTQSTVSGNLIINDLWKITDTNLLIAFKNEYKNISTNTTYLLYPAPPVLQAQRTALSGTEGMQVYQTDGTIGTYVYTIGAWKRVNLV